MPEIRSEENIYFRCRKRANEKSEKEQFKSRDKAFEQFYIRDIKISASSLKDYESGKQCLLQIRYLRWQKYMALQN